MSLEDFNSILGQIREPSEAGIPATMYDDLSGMYANTLGSVQSLTDGMAEKDSIISGLQSELSELRAKNYDMVAQGAAAPGATEGSNVNTPDENPADDEDISVDQLFGK